MSSVAVATDSTNYLPRSLIDSEHVHQVSLYVGWQGESQRELDMDGFDAFYARLARDPDLPTTSQAGSPAPARQRARRRRCYPSVATASASR